MPLWLALFWYTDTQAKASGTTGNRQRNPAAFMGGLRSGGLRQERTVHLRTCVSVQTAQGNCGPVLARPYAYRQVPTRNKLHKSRAQSLRLWQDVTWPSPTAGCWKTTGQFRNGPSLGWDRARERSESFSLPARRIRAIPGHWPGRLYQGSCSTLRSVAGRRLSRERRSPSPSATAGCRRVPAGAILRPDWGRSRQPAPAATRRLATAFRG